MTETVHAADELAWYDAGLRDGIDIGRLLEARERDQLWHEAADPIARGADPFAELESLRWGPGGREHFGERRAGDYVPRPAVQDETVWLFGPVVHRHICNAACRAIQAGRYIPAAAAVILASLPGDYGEVIAGLRQAAAASASRGDAA